MIETISILFKLAGVVFLLIAAIGVMRLPDPFQRMHAATKAGTLGAGLVIIGSVVAHGTVDAVLLGLMTVVFLLLTVPVAGHLLGRAAYVSGARLALAGEDALRGILPRADTALDERMKWSGAVIPGANAVQTGSMRNVGYASDEESEEGSTKTPYMVQPLAGLRAVSVAVIDGQVRPVVERASQVAALRGAKLTAHVLIDKQAIVSSADQVTVRRSIRERASIAISDMKACSLAMDMTELNYDECDPEQILSSSADPGENLLVLPCDGWFHHQVSARLELTTWEPDGLLRLPGVHRGPVLFVSSDVRQAKAASIVVRDGNEPHIASLVEWALRHKLWDTNTLVHVHDPHCRRWEMRDIAERFNHNYVSITRRGLSCDIPESLTGYCAVILGRTPRPLRTNWYGNHWRNRIAPGMSVDVLIMEASGHELRKSG